MDPRFEAVQSDEGSCLRCLYFTCDDFADDHTWHYHPEYELTWIIRSSGTRFVGDSIERYGSGDLVLVGPDLPHCWHNERDGEGPGPELIVLQFSKACLGEGLLDLPEAAHLRRMLEEAQCGLHFRGEVVQRVGELLRTVIALNGLSRLIRFFEVLNLLALSSDRVALAKPDYQLNNDINAVNRERMERVHEYVHANLSGTICQAEIAARVGLSAAAFSRFFRAATGKTFVGFVNLLRVNQACRMLTSTKLNVTQVATDCGYDNISNFNRQFLAQKGMNPREYRLRARALSAVETSPPAVSTPRVVARRS